MADNRRVVSKKSDAKSYQGEQDSVPQLGMPQQGHQADRSAELTKLMDDYKKATQEQSFRSRNTGTRAASIALSSPAAASALANGRRKFQDAPVQAISGGIKQGRNMTAMKDSVGDLASQDEDRDPNSNSSRMAADYVFEQFGVKVPKGATAQDIKKTFPYVQADSKRDTSERGQDMTFETNNKNRISRQKEGYYNRGSREKIGAAHDTAGVGRVIIGGVLGQDKAAAAGTSGGTQKTANAATIPDAYNPRGFYVSKPGMPPDQEREKAVSALGGQSVKYQQALQRASDLIKSANGDPTILNQKWPAIQSAFGEATQRNIKAMGNGVANGPDIEQAIRIIGSPTDLVTWLRGGLGQKMDQAILSIPAAYKSFADSQGYVPSDKPSDITNSLGTGGANSSRKPVNPALGSSANSIAGQYGFGPVTGGNNPSGTPDIPTQKAPQSQGVPVVVTLRSGQKVNAIRMPDGKIVRQ